MAEPRLHAMQDQLKTSHHPKCSQLVDATAVSLLLPRQEWTSEPVSQFLDVLRGTPLSSNKVQDETTHPSYMHVQWPHTVHHATMHVPQRVYIHFGNLSKAMQRAACGLLWEMLPNMQANCFVWMIS